MKNLIGLNIGVTVACLLLSITLCGKVEDCKKEIVNIQNAQAVEFSEEQANIPDLIGFEDDDPMEYKSAYVDGYVDGYDEGFCESWFFTMEDIQVVKNGDSVDVYTIDPDGEIQIYEKEIQDEYVK